MSKYAPLADFLRKARRSEVPLSFVEIERIIGQDLPASSRKYPAWWSNNPSNNVMTRTWLEAGFQTERVDVPAGKVVFRNLRAPVSQRPGVSGRSDRRHPIFGCMDGSVTVAAGVDLAGPADPSWAARA